MTKTWMVIALLMTASPASAQLGGILQQAQAARDRAAELTVTEAEEQRIGATVSEKVRQRFGVVQDAAVHKYVTLVGTALAQQTSRRNLPWTFVVLDTDGVNAFAAPGGYVHITRGALGLIKSEAELAGVLGHEIMHVVGKHTVNAIRKTRSVTFAANEVAANRPQVIDRIADRAYAMVLENEFDRGDELDADKEGALLAQKLGYQPGALADFLLRLDQRNASQTERNGLFASHPATTERIGRIRQLPGSKTGAMVAARYTGTIGYRTTELAQLAVAAESGAATATPATQEKGFGLGTLGRIVSPESSSQQVTASGGARGLGRDRLAKGGDNPAIVKVGVSADEVAAFRRGIA